MNSSNIVQICSSSALLGLLSLACQSPSPDSGVLDDEFIEEQVDLASVTEPPVQNGEGVFYVTSDDPRKPFARYLDGQISLSNSCGVKTENKLNRRIPPLYVNGQPIGFC